MATAVITTGFYLSPGKIPFLNYPIKVGHKSRELLDIPFVLARTLDR